jgi:hypothetical protein
MEIEISYYILKTKYNKFKIKTQKQYKGKSSIQKRGAGR